MLKVETLKEKQNISPSGSLEFGLKSIFFKQQEGAPSHWHLSVRDWIGHKESPEKACILWLPRSPDLMPCNFYLWVLIKDFMYVSPLPAHLLPDLRHRIEAAVARISSETLKNVLDELAYRIDLCRVNNRAHIEHLQTGR
ncbi:uncharacterized protein TNCV_297121 [Trichonephila clavipes]|nr:uncharacterized protein TNCV_297121 [Trichonephila clavipes]